MTKANINNVKKSAQYYNRANMPTFPNPKEGDFPRLASPEGPPWLGLRGRKF